MTISTDLDLISDNYEQSSTAIEFRDLFRKRFIELSRMSDQVKMAAAGDTNFSAIPVDVKQAMTGYWQLVKDFVAAVQADPDIWEMLNWNKTVAPLPDPIPPEENP
jgi:hypothetical protein